MAFTEDDLLAIADRVLPEDYLDGMKAVGPGYELLQAGAKVFARLSRAADNLDRGLYMISAAGGARATAPIELYRSSATAGAFTQKAGSILRASRGGQQFLLAADVAFGALALTAAGTAIAIADGWEWNVPGPVTTARGEVLPGDIDTIDLPLQDPPYSDPTVLVRQTANATGGAGPMLDALANDRDVFREPNEGDPSLAVRARQIPDVVSPPAIIRQLDRVLGALGISYERVRWWEFQFQSCWDAPDVALGDYAGAAQVFFYDDPRDPATFPDGWRNRWDGAEAQGAVVIIIDNIAAAEDHGLVYDDPATTLVGHQTDRGAYAPGAYDFPEEGVGVIGALRPAYDGTDIAREKLLRRLYKLLEDITGGVPFYLELRGQ